MRSKTLRCRPREGGPSSPFGLRRTSQALARRSSLAKAGDPYAAAKRCGRAAISETSVVMGPRFRGDDSGLVCAKKYLSTLDPRAGPREGGDFAGMNR